MQTAPEKIDLADSPSLRLPATFPEIPDHHDPLDSTFQPELQPGFVLDDRFVIGEAISRSGMATIYKAQDKQLNQTVAVKVPHLMYKINPTFFTRFQREEQTGLRLNHPLILQFIPVEGRKNRPYIVTEYLRGSTLARHLSLHRPLPEKDALKIASLLCDALHYLHSQEVIHRDLKPANIMLCTDRTIRLMDLGIAANLSEQRLTIADFSTMMGTPDYISPEQVLNKHVDERTDVYGLGALLYEMVTGGVPFQNPDPFTAINDRITGDPAAPRKLNSKLSPQAEEIILHAMQRNPADRYQSAADMKAELDAPEKVTVTGYCDRLQAPHWKLGFRTSPVITGILLTVGYLVLQVLMFYYFSHYYFVKK